MKVGMIGLGRMGEGMSRRLIAAGHEVHGYRNNVKKADEQYEKGYISGYTTSVESLVQVIKTKEVYGEKSGETLHFPQPGVFMMVVPAETVEETLDELLRYCREGDIIIDHGNSNFKDSRKRAERLAKLGIAYLDCGTSGGVYGLDRGYCLMVGGGDTAVATCAPVFNALSPGIAAAERTQPDDFVRQSEMGWLHCGGPGAGHFVKMVHNGIEYGIMQAYAEGFISYTKQMQVPSTSKQEMLKLLQWITQKTISTTLTLLKWLSFGVVVAWLVVGYSILPLLYYAAIESLAISMGEYQTLVKGVGLFTLLWILAYPLLSSALLSMRDLILAVLVLSRPRF